MLKLATVFSGIGSIEHALERLGIDYSIEFACDNGDVDILSKDISDTITDVQSEIVELEGIIGKEDEYDEWLNEKLDKVSRLLTDFEIEILKLDVNQFNPVIELASELSEKKVFNSSQQKFYNSTLNRIIKADPLLDILEKVYQSIRLSIKLYNDLPKLKSNTVRFPELEISITSLKHYTQQFKAIREELSMLHERVNTEKIREKVFNLPTLEEQKKYVDSLYKGRENQNNVRKSYFANYDIDDSRFHWNVSFLDGKKFTDIDLFVGGSPCQSFSLVGKQRGLGDTRGTLFYEYARLVDEIKPKVFIYENVKAILSNDGGQTWKTMTKIFDDLGYEWQYQILNAKDYGIPQNRERVFVVGFRNDLDFKDFSFPEKIELTKVMQDFLVDNVSGKYYLTKKGVEFVLSDKNLEKRYTQIDGEIQLCQKKNQQFNWHGDFVFEEENKDKEKLMKDLDKYFLSEKVKKYVLASGTKGFYSKPETDLEIARPLLTTMHKMHRAGVDNYVTTEGRLRKLTPRECLRLMGYCDSFKIVVSDTAVYQQAGNSIVVDVMMAIVKQIFEAYPKLGK
jgi:DNA (cytosine-5-)-methyltransferase